MCTAPDNWVDPQPRDGECDLSIIVVNWNTRDLLVQCLTSVFGQTRGCRFEVIVIDNASADGSAEMIAQRFPRVRLICNASNRGFAPACNQGLRVAGGRYVLLLNSDTIVLDDALSRLVTFMDAHPDVGAGGCMLLYPDGRCQPSCGWFPTLAGTLFHGLNPFALWARVKDKRKYFPAPFLSFARHASECDVGWIVGACLMVRREALDQVGLMDEGIFMFAEEWEWCYRIKAAGWRIVYTPTARITHIGAASWTMADVKRVYAILAGQQYFYIKHYGRAKAALMKTFIFLNALVKTALWAGLWVCRPSGRTRMSGEVQWHLHSLRWCLRPTHNKMISCADIEAPALQGPADA